MEVAVLGQQCAQRPRQPHLICWVCRLFGDLGQRDLELVHFQESRAPVILNV